VCAASALALVVAGCDANGDGAAWEGPPRPSPGGTVSVDEFDAYLEDVDEAWERSAAMTAVHFLRLDEQEAARTTIEGTAPAEGPGPETVVVTLDGLLDDSVRAVRWTLSFSPQGEGFRLTSARWAQRCQPGRGHQDFTPEPCL
jgi:hypothetical protein